jgi:TPR repeat protein
MHREERRISIKIAILFALCALVLPLPARPAAAVKTPVYVAQFRQNGDDSAFPDLGKFLASSIRLRLAQLSSVQAFANQKSPCEIMPIRGSSQQTAPEVAPPSDSDSFTIRGTVEVHDSGQPSDSDVLVTYELVRSAGCAVAWSRTEKFDVSDMLDRFGAIGDTLANELAKAMGARRIRVEVMPVEVTGGGTMKARAVSLVERYLKVRLSAIRDVDADFETVTPPSVTGDYALKVSIDFQANGRVIGKSQVFTPSRAYPPHSPQRSIQIQEKGGSDIGDLALDLATDVVGDMNQIRSLTQAGVEKTSDVSVLLDTAAGIMCGAGTFDLEQCTQKPKEALAVLTQIPAAQLNLKARLLIGRANSILDNDPVAASTFEDALKMPDINTADRLAALRGAGDAWYALQNYSRAGARYGEYFTLGKSQDLTQPSAKARMVDVSVNWSHTFLLSSPPDKPRALRILLDSIPAVGDEKEFRTEIKNILSGQTPADLEQSIKTVSVSLGAKDELIGWGYNRLGETYDDGGGVTKDYAKALAYYREGADAGNAAAMDNLGYMYEKGRLVAQDYAQAFAWYMKAADAGDLVALNDLGRLYEKGNGVPRDLAAARSWYEKGALAGNATAMENLGYLYEKGMGGEVDFAKAMSWYVKSAADGNSTAMYDLGHLYENGLGVKTDYALARTNYEKSANAGSSMGMEALGYLYEKGRGGQLDYATARAWYDKAATLGDSLAMTDLGHLYEQGYGVPVDYAKAREWYEKAADAGSASGIDSLGYLYEKGRGVAVDYVKARELYQKAADAGSTTALTDLGVIYDNGLGVAPDFATAKMWYEKGASAGNASAMNYLGYWYLQGHGGAPDYAQARAWFEKAADAGSTNAMTNLGDLYQQGLGVVKDTKKAKEWYDKANSSRSQ